MPTVEAEKRDALERLADYLPRGSRVYTVRRHRTAGGHRERIDFFTIVPTHQGPELAFITGYVAKALGLKHSTEGGAVVTGGGVENGKDCTFELSGLLHGGDIRALRHDII